MNDLWRYDSWVPPLLGGDDLQVLRTDADTDALPSAAGGGADSLGIGLARRSASLEFGKGGAVLVRSCSGALVSPQPVLRGPACRSSCRPSTALPCGGAVPMPSVLRTGGQALSCRRKSIDPFSLAQGMDGDADLGCELPFCWDDTELPFESAWLFDPSSDPSSEPLVTSCAGHGGTLPPACASEPKSPVSVFHGASASWSDSNSSESSDHEDAAGKAGVAHEVLSNAPTPECSADTTMTRHGSARQLGQDTSGADSRGTSTKRQAPEPPVKDDADELTSEPFDAINNENKKPRRAASKSLTKAAAGRNRPPAVPARAPGSAPPKKSKGRQACVQCFTMSTPQWREGPQGARTLCNACGVRYRKQLNLAKKLQQGTI